MIDPVFKKLNFKEQKVISILNAPEEFRYRIEAMQHLAELKTDISNESVEFLLIFVISKDEIREAARQIAQIPEGDFLLWFAYPKKSSKKYKSDISRDDGWQVLGDLGYEGVRMVAIDEDWSALRLRKAEYIKTMKRDPRMAMSKSGLKKTRKQ